MSFMSESLIATQSLAESVKCSSSMWFKEDDASRGSGEIGAGVYTLNAGEWATKLC